MNLIGNLLSRVYWVKIYFMRADFSRKGNWRDHGKPECLSKGKGCQKEEGIGRNPRKGEK